MKKKGVKKIKDVKERLKLRKRQKKIKLSHLDLQFLICSPRLKSHPSFITFAEEVDGIGFGCAKAPEGIPWISFITSENEKKT